MIKSTQEARRMANARKHPSGGRRGRMPGAISNAPRCACGCGLTLRRAKQRHPLMAVRQEKQNRQKGNRTEEEKS